MQPSETSLFKKDVKQRRYCYEQATTSSIAKCILHKMRAWPEHKKVIIKGDGNEFMRYSHFCQAIDELHLTLIRDRVIMLAGDHNGGRAVPVHRWTTGSFPTSN